MARLTKSFVACFVSAGLMHVLLHAEVVSAVAPSSTAASTHGRAGTASVLFLDAQQSGPGFMGQTVAVGEVAQKASIAIAGSIHLPGESITVTGIGFSPGETVKLSFRTLGRPDRSLTTVSNEFGIISNSDFVTDLQDVVSNFVVIATGLLSGSRARASFATSAIVGPDKLDYHAADTAAITGAGFLPGEIVTLQVTHVSELADGHGHEPFYTQADDRGRFSSSWFVDPDETPGSILRLSARGDDSGIRLETFFTNAAVKFVDDAGPDDKPGQKDLNTMTLDRGGLPNSLAVQWTWDNTGWPGANTGDACMLYDADGDGNANFSLCVTVTSSPAAYQVTRLYSCGDSRRDRCSQPVIPVSTFESVCSAEVVERIDPFQASPSHTLQTCFGAECNTADTQATCTVKMSDVGTTSAVLLNVCSYASQQPNSAPADCILRPRTGFLTIRKIIDPGDTQAFTFNLGEGQQALDGRTSFSITPSSQTGIGVEELIPLLASQASTPLVSALADPSIQATTGYDLTEVLPDGWRLDDVVCTLSDGATTGRRDGTTISGFQIQAGRETTCTFNDSRKRSNLSIVKTGNGPIDAGRMAEFTLTVSNTGAADATGVIVTDTLPSGTWSVTAPAIAGCPSPATGTLTCAFNGALASDATVTITLSRPTTADDCGALDNSATVSATNEQPGATSDNTSATTIIVQCPDVAIVKSGNGPVDIGSTATFTVTVSNIGSGHATDVVVTDRLPSGGWTVTAPSFAGCPSPATGILTCTFAGPLAANAQVTIQVSRTVTAEDCDGLDNSLNNNVTVAASNEPAANQNNNIIVRLDPDFQLPRGGDGRGDRREGDGGRGHGDVHFQPDGADDRGVVGVVHEEWDGNPGRGLQSGSLPRPRRDVLGGRVDGDQDGDGAQRRAGRPGGDGDRDAHNGRPLHHWVAERGDGDDCGCDAGDHGGGDRRRPYRGRGPGDVHLQPDGTGDRGVDGVVHDGWYGDPGRGLQSESLPRDVPGGPVDGDPAGDGAQRRAGRPG